MYLEIRLSKRTTRFVPIQDTQKIFSFRTKIGIVSFYRLTRKDEIYVKFDSGAWLTLEQYNGLVLERKAQ